MTLTIDDVELSLRQFSGAWRLMCGGAPGCVMETGDGIEYVFSGVPIPFFNVALLTGRHGISARQLQARACESTAFASDQQVPWFFVVTHDALEAEVDPTSLLLECDLAPVMPLTGMVADRVAPVSVLPAGLELTVPDDEAGCSAMLDINSAAYAMDLSAGKDLLGKPSFWNGHFPVLGLVGGTPAATAAVMMVDRVRYVALVATEPARQRRGYADAAMRRALELSAGVHTECATVLHATEAGRPIYERMGYRAIAKHTLYMEQRFVTAH
jgi:hypothetical protein